MCFIFGTVVYFVVSHSNFIKVGSPIYCCAALKSVLVSNLIV